MFVCLFFCNFLETTISNSSQKFSESQISILELFFFKEIKNSKRFRKIIKRTAKRKNVSKTIKKRFSTIAESVFNSKLQLCSNNIRAALFVQHFNFVQSVTVFFRSENQIFFPFSPEKVPYSTSKIFLLAHLFPISTSANSSYCLQQKSK